MLEESILCSHTPVANSTCPSWLFNIVLNHMVKVVLNQLGYVSHLSCYIQARVIGVKEVIFEKGMI